MQLTARGRASERKGGKEKATELLLPETACRMRILWPPALTRSQRDRHPGQATWVERRKKGKQKQSAERIAGNRIAFLSFITRNGKQRNYHLTHSSGNGKGV